MANRMGRKRRNDLIYAVCCVGFLTALPADADTLRIGLAHSSEVDVRCDGPLAVVLGTGGGVPIDRPPGVYTLRVVERSSFLRTPPWTAGLIAAPNPPLLIQTAIPQSQSAWRVELLRTTSKATAQRAERDARRRIGGRITATEKEGWFFLVAGPFPNEYLANQTLKKARSLGFPARIREVTTDDLWEMAGAAPAPREIRRLVPEGEVLAPPQDAGLGIRIPAPQEEPALSSAPALDLEPLDLLPPGELDLEPLPTLEPEELLIEPLPEPEKTELDPAVGYRPAPPAKAEPAPPLKKIEPPLARPPQRRVQPRSLPSPPPPRPQFAQPPAPPKEALPRLQPSAPSQAAEPGRPLPPPPSRIEGPVAQAPPPPSSPPRLRMEAPSPPSRETREEPYIFHPPDRGNRIAQGLKSLPIIRRFWWERPLVSPPEEAMRQNLDEALRTPAEEREASRYTRLPEEVSETAPPQVDLPEVPPTPRPFDLAEAGEGPVAPFPPTEPAELSPDTPADPTFEESILPPGPGAERRTQDPIFIPGEPTVQTPPSTGARGPATSPATTGPAKSIVAPDHRPIARAYVQLFDENGNPVTEPASAITLEPLTGSHLEYNGNGFNGTFQAYAPSPDWLVLVNIVDMEDYLPGIVPNEIPEGAPIEVLQAQTILSRCYALLLAQRGDYADFGYDIPGTPDSEWPYSGRALETDQTRRAARETAGEVLVDSGGSVATPVYCFSSGGYVADARSVWGGTAEPVPDYLEAHPDFSPANVGFEAPPEGFANNERALEDWLKASPNTYDKKAAGGRFRWTKELSGREMDALINAFWNNQVGEVEEIRIAKRAISGHATEMVVEGDDQTVTARDADSIRQALGLDSSLVVVKKDFGGGWTLYGGGYGHGVGMSQCGAIGLVEQENANYKEILNFYFGRLLLGKRSLVRSSRGA